MSAVEGAESVGLSADGKLIDGSGNVIPISSDNLAGDVGMATGDFSKASDADTVLFTAPVAGIVQINVISTQAFADGDGAQPEFAIGNGSDANKWLASGVYYTDAAIYKPFVISGTVTAGETVNIARANGTGTSTGILNIGVTFVAD